MTIPASIADLVRLKGEIDEALIDMLNRPCDEKTVADLKRRKLHLHEEIECLIQETGGAGRDPH